MLPVQPYGPQGCRRGRDGDHRPDTIISISLEAGLPALHGASANIPKRNEPKFNRDQTR
jgi:hypothetical protein